MFTYSNTKEEITYYLINTCTIKINLTTIYCLSTNITTYNSFNIKIFICSNWNSIRTTERIKQLLESFNCAIIQSIYTNEWLIPADTKAFPHSRSDRLRVTPFSFPI